MPIHMVFVRDMILNNPFIYDWEDIRRYKQQLIHRKKQTENKNCKPHTYRVREKVLV